MTEREKILIERYKNVFSSPDGRKVLADILGIVGAFGMGAVQAATPDECVQNITTALMQRLGFIKQWDGQSRKPTPEAYERIAMQITETK